MHKVALGLVLVLGLCISSQGIELAKKSTPLATGSVTMVKAAQCPSSFFPGMACSTGMIVGCPGADDIGFTYGVISPVGSSPKGTIVLHDGAGGTTPFYGNPGKGFNYPLIYLNAGYQIVQITWDDDWENVNQPSGGNNALSVKNAACRPATFFKYVYTSVHTGSGGMCLQGHSGGSGAVAYSLAEYDAGSYVDKALLTSGPVFGDIRAGCEVPNFMNGNSLAVCYEGQFGCNGLPWLDKPEYRPNAMRQWVGGTPACNNSQGARTPPPETATWKAMSVVDDLSDSTFSYPQTALSGWLCSNGMNNSAAQGEFYYVNFMGSGQLAVFSLNRVDGCPGPEDIWDGTVNDGMKSAFWASAADMIDGCIKRH